MEQKNKNIFVAMGQSRWTGTILNLVLISMVAIFGILAYWQFKEYNILEPQIGNYTLEKDTYVQGEEFRVKFVICKNLPYQEQVLGRFVDGVIFSTPDINSNFEVKCYDTFISSVSIPKTLPAGTYVYQETIVYHPNPLKEISYTFTTPEFTVVEKE
jgi:hypothetical protein